MAQIVKYCKKCFQDPYKYAEHICSIADLDMQYMINEGSIGYYIVSTDDEYCLYHPEEKMIISNLTVEEYNYLILNINPKIDFVHAMDELKGDDPIEFQLKMSQFKANLGQQESNKAQTDNKVHCKYCNSTNVKKISGLSKAGSVALWGIFSKKVHNEFHCNNCGADF